MLLIESIYTSRIYYRNLRKSDVQYYGIIYRVTFRSTLYRFISTFRLTKVSSSKQRLFSAVQQIASRRNPLGQKETVETAR